MAKPKMKSGLPDAIERREILAGNRKNVDLDALGERYLAAGWLSDATEFFERTKNLPKLQEIKRRAVEADVFILQRLAKIPGVEVTAEDWRRAAEAALAAGRDRHAALAFERAGDATRAAEAKARADALRAELKPPTKGRTGGDLV
jgi:hypothetical protein